MKRSTWCTGALCAVLALISPSVLSLSKTEALSLSEGRPIQSPSVSDTPVALTTPAPSGVLRAHSLAFPVDLDTAEETRQNTLEALAQNSHSSLKMHIEEVADAILEASDRYEFEPELLLALIQTESSFRPTVRSRAGAIGLMQLLPRTARSVARDLQIPWRGTSTLTDPVTNVRLGAHYLAQLEEQFNGDRHLALSAYNLGPSRVRRYLRKGKRPAWYAGKVEAARQEFLRETAARELLLRGDVPRIAHNLGV